MNRRGFLASLSAAAGAAAVGGLAASAEAAPLDSLEGMADLQSGADLPAEGARDAQWVTQCYYTRDGWGRRVRVCRRVPVRRRRRRCWWTYDRWGRRVRVCN
jgi:hypothetical protein